VLPRRLRGRLQLDFAERFYRRASPGRNVGRPEVAAAPNAVPEKTVKFLLALQRLIDGRRQMRKKIAGDKAQSFKRDAAISAQASIFFLETVPCPPRRLRVKANHRSAGVGGVRCGKSRTP